jgi:hypothetical protein
MKTAALVKPLRDVYARFRNLLGSESFNSWAAAAHTAVTSTGPKGVLYLVRPSAIPSLFNRFSARSNPAARIENLWCALFAVFGSLSR